MNLSARLYLLYSCIPFVFTGCSSVSDAAYKTFVSAFHDDSKVMADASLNKDLSYLRVNIAGLEALMVKGYIDQDKLGPIDVWYSSDGSVLRLQKGRYLGSLGFDQNWQNVQLQDAPELSNIVSQFKRETASTQLKSVASFYPEQQYFFSRFKTEMPGYQSTLQERVGVSVQDASPPNIPKSLNTYLNTSEIVWVSEKSLKNNEKAKNNSSYAWYGFKKINSSYVQVIGQQCLSADFCITWMPWPIQ
jgi:hypothetical protein